MQEEQVTIVDGTALAADIRAQLVPVFAEWPHEPRLAIVRRHDLGPAASFLSVKQRVGRAIGVTVEEVYYASEWDTAAAAETVSTAAQGSDGIVVQLPLPPALDTQQVLNAIPTERDVDVLSEAARQQFTIDTFPVLPPVVAAIRSILMRYAIPISGARVVVLGDGRLVGTPAAVWFRNQGAIVAGHTHLSEDAQNDLAVADIVVLGTGGVHELQPDYCKSGVVILDAGAGTETGTLAPSAAPECASVASYLTPVPGGIGPLTVAHLYRNMAMLGGTTLGEV